MTERSDLLLFERMCENDCAVISLLFCTCTPELPLWRLELQIFWRFAYFKVMKIIQGSHVIILYHFCSLYLAVYFYIDSTYESLWTMRYWSSSNCEGFIYMNELKGGAVCLCWCKTLLSDVPGLLNGNKLGFQTFTPLATYFKAEQIEIKFNHWP